MPELPEVETVRIGLQQFLPGKVIAGETHDWPKGFPNAPEDVREFLVGAKIRQVKRRAKVLIIELDSKYSLVIHLKMTGQLVYVREAHKLTADSGQLKKGLELVIRVTRWSENSQTKVRELYSRSRTVPSFSSMTSGSSVGCGYCRPPKCRT